MVAFGDGTQTRDFTYVSDTARGIALAGSSEMAVGKTINLGSGAEISINDLAKEIANVLGQAQANIEHDIPRPGDVLRLYADPARARELLGFEAQVSFAEGLARLKDWYLGQGQTPEQLLENEIVRNWQVAGEA